jgi:uncharacterized protein (AIM24 family)
MRCHDVVYEPFGDDMQILEVELDPSETVIAEAGAMNYMDDGITFETRMGDGSRAGGSIMDSLLDVGKRVLTGESIFVTHFSNTGIGNKNGRCKTHLVQIWAKARKGNAFRAVTVIGSR